MKYTSLGTFTLVNVLDFDDSIACAIICLHIQRLYALKRKLFNNLVRGKPSV